MYRSKEGWRVQWSEEGRRRTKKFDSQKAAERFEMELKLGIADRSSVRKRLMTFREFSERWMRDYCRLEKAESQWVGDESALRIHILPALGDRPLGGIGKTDLAALRIEMRGKLHMKTQKPLSAKTVNNHIILLKKMFGTAVDWGLIPTDPSKSIKRFPVEEQVRAYWSVAERDHFWRFARHEDRPFAELCMLACHTGMRLGELRGLQQRQIDFERRTILVNAIYCSKSKQRLMRTKSKKIGYVPLNAAAMAILESRRLMAPTDLVFEPSVSEQAVRKLGRLCEKVGCQRIRFHDLRHTFASNLVEAGVSLYSVQRMMRHTSATSTMRYSHLSNEALHEAVGVLCQDAHPPLTKAREIS